MNPAPITTSASAKLQLESNPPGVDIEVDGSFVGNTSTDFQIAERETRPEPLVWGCHSRMGLPARLAKTKSSDPKNLALWRHRLRTSAMTPR
jgi:hypothetical protein